MDLDSTAAITNKQLREFTDKLQSLHTRMDRFYEWAGVLQKEYRAMQQRVSYLESQCELDMGQTAQDSCLQQRLRQVKQDQPP